MGELSVPENVLSAPPINDERKTSVKRPNQRRTEPSWKAQQLRDLKRLNQQGQLAIFVGAGISHGCGLPGWDALVQTLAAAAYQGGEASVREAMTKFNTVIQGRILRTRLKTRFNWSVARAL